MYVALDGPNLFHVLWHAQGGRGVTDAVLARIDAINVAWRPETIVVGFDAPPLFRRKLYPDYKAGRPEREQSLVDNLAALPAAVSRQGIARPSGFEGFEADDVLATVATSALDSGRKCLLVSGDSDLRQCLFPGRVTIAKKLSLSGGKLSAEYVTAETHFDEKGVPCERWIDYLALVGSKNAVPGVEGIGPETARKLLAGAGSLANLLLPGSAWGPACTPKIRSRLSAWQQSGGMDRDLSLVRLRRDVPLVKEAL